MRTEPKPRPAADLPLHTVAEEIAFLRKTFGEIVGAYSARIDAELAQLHAAVSTDAGSKRKLPADRVHDLRDMLSLLRSLEVKPAKGRRRDLKKVETVAADLREVAERWA